MTGVVPTTDAVVALVVAKAPVPGQVKTRLAAQVGAEAAARLASAALLDTLDVCEQVFEHCWLALTGDLAAAVDGRAVAARRGRWTVVPQRGTGLAHRLSCAHSDVAAATGLPVVQVGMDTPHAPAVALAGVATALRAAPAVLGPAEDGGWWVLGLVDGRDAEALLEVPMSTPGTGVATRRALEQRGLAVATAPTLCDVDTAEDAVRVAEEAPGTRFAAAWRALAA